MAGVPGLNLIGMFLSTLIMLGGVGLILGTFLRIRSVQNIDFQSDTLSMKETIENLNIYNSRMKDGLIMMIVAIIVLPISVGCLLVAEFFTLGEL